ncbi:hypothetical protein BX600DRAFT_53059 [Xylariales sp. PMI_506]|nr:hypothetical protein BX600DRAFT_53059 [Xylariales sp. PMI_506]
MSQIAFVPTDPLARFTILERQLIRRHCMLGKNKQPGSRRSRREAAKAVAAAAPKADDGGGVVREQEEEQKQDSVERDTTQPKTMATPASSWVRARTAWCHPGESQEKKTFERRDRLPPPPPSDWALFRFPEELDDVSQLMLHKYFRCNPIRDPICPFDLFEVMIEWGQSPMFCFKLLSSEVLCFHTTLLLTAAADDLVARRPLSATAYRHLRRALPILNERLADPHAFDYDFVFYAISILASVALVFGEYAAAAAHAAGMRQIIRLRGGIRALDYNPLAQMSLDRLNFLSRLITKTWEPLFESTAWEIPSFPNHVAALQKEHHSLCIDGLADPELVPVFETLQKTSLLLNYHYYSKTTIDGKNLQKYLGFVHSQLLEFDGRGWDDRSERIRLSMLMFLTTTFRLPGWRTLYNCQPLAEESMKLFMKSVNEKNGQAGVGDKAPSIDTAASSNATDIWSIIICTIFLPNAATKKSVRLRWKLANAAREGSWEEVRQCLKTVMWVDSFHDELGKRAFEVLEGHGQPMPE